jgi:hypothetical protein
MPQFVHFDLSWVSNLWREQPYGKTQKEISDAVNSFASELWRESGDQVPDKASGGHKWVHAGRLITKLGTIIMVAWVLSSILSIYGVPLIWPPEDEGRDFFIGCVIVVPALIFLLLLLVGRRMTKHGERLLLPFDVSKSVPSGRLPIVGRLVKVLGWLLSGNVRGLFVFFFISIWCLSIALYFSPNMDHATQVALFIAFGYFFFLGGARFLASRITRIGHG